MEIHMLVFWISIAMGLLFGVLTIVNMLSIFKKGKFSLILPVLCIICFGLGYGITKIFPEEE